MVKLSKQAKTVRGKLFFIMCIVVLSIISNSVIPFLVSIPLKYCLRFRTVNLLSSTVLKSKVIPSKKSCKAGTKITMSNITLTLSKLEGLFCLFLLPQTAKPLVLWYLIQLTPLSYRVSL